MYRLHTGIQIKPYTDSGLFTWIQMGAECPRYRRQDTCALHLVSLQLLKQNNFIFIEFQFHVTESRDLKLFAIRVQYIQWVMLE
jgi:hypothetical protein